MIAAIAPVASGHDPFRQAVRSPISMVTLTFLAGWNTSLSGAGSGSAGRIMAAFGASGSLSPAVRTIASTGDRPTVLGFALCFLGIFTR